MKFETKKKLITLQLYLYYSVFILLALFLIGGTVACFYVYQVEEGRQAAIDGGVIAEAEIIRIHDATGGGNSGGGAIYELRYEYTDATGIKYWGVAESGINSLKYAESQIGKKVNIYIDGKGNSIVVGQGTNKYPILVVALVLMVGSIVAIAFDIWFIFFQGKKSKKKEQAKETVAAQKVVPKGATAKKKR